MDSREDSFHKPHGHPLCFGVTVKGHVFGQTEAYITIRFACLKGNVGSGLGLDTAKGNSILEEVGRIGCVPYFQECLARQTPQFMTQIPWTSKGR